MILYQAPGRHSLYLVGYRPGRPRIIVKGPASTCSLRHQHRTTGSGTPSSRPARRRIVQGFVDDVVDPRHHGEEQDEVVAVGVELHRLVELRIGKEARGPLGGED